MSEEQNSGNNQPNQQPAGSQGSAGQRLDQFLSNAQRLGNMAGRRAREVADAAAPRLKDLGQAASANASRMFDQRVPRGSALDRLRSQFQSGGSRRKMLVIYGGLTGAVLLLSLIFVGLSCSRPGTRRG